ncbi:MAG: DoxX family protein [Sediminibacterium sp.]|nr:DoxX family protein [Sediminibacterium sp.]
MKSRLFSFNRYFIGVLFIFSGLIKANDPNGLSYKMQEFFEAWDFLSLYDYSLYFSVMMNCFEIVAGVAIIIRWQYKLVLRLLLLLIIFFSFLTAYALFSGKIATCGCFGDCLPLTPLQSFLKDILLLVLILINLIFDKKAEAVAKTLVPIYLNLIAFVLSLSLQLYVLKNLPFLDCLPYKVGNNILTEMETPKNAIPDSTSIYFTYKKNGKEINFEQSQFPDDFDDTYQYVSREVVVVKKGNGLLPKISDFQLKSVSGTDTTLAIFNQEKPYILIYSLYPKNVENWTKIFEKLKAQNKPVFMVTADITAAKSIFPDLTILQCDATNLKTAARVNPTIFEMDKATILKKYVY